MNPTSRRFSLFLALACLALLSAFLAAPLRASPEPLPPGVRVTTTERAEDPEAVVRVVPFDAWVLVDGAVVYHGPAVFVNEHMVGAATEPKVFVATERQLVVIDLPPDCDVLITTKPPTHQSMIPLGHFPLRLSSNGANLYSGEPWSLHIQREAHETGIEAQVADNFGAHIFKFELGDHVEARSYIP